MIGFVGFEERQTGRTDSPAPLSSFTCRYIRIDWRGFYACVLLYAMGCVEITIKAWAHLQLQLHQTGGSGVFSGIGRARGVRNHLGATSVPGLLGQILQIAHWTNVRYRACEAKCDKEQRPV